MNMEKFERRHPLHRNVYPFITAGRFGRRPSEAIQQEIINGITQPFMGYLKNAAEGKDIELALCLMCRPDDILDIYTTKGFDLVVPVQQKLRDALWILFRF